MTKDRRRRVAAKDVKVLQALLVVLLAALLGERISGYHV